MELKFVKMEGIGNDFILIDDRDEFIEKTISYPELACRLCDRHFGIGADGLILIEKDDNFDFLMRYFNADGKEGTMCGNGGRCSVAYAANNGIIKGTETNFNAIDGLHSAILVNNKYVSLKMSDVSEITETNNSFYVNTGSPHFIQFTSNIKDINVYQSGKEIRNQTKHQPSGINVNFVEIESDKIKIRTYERGVENETLACGTGSVASAVATKINANDGNYVVNVETLGGLLVVKFTKYEKMFKNIYLNGPANYVYSGKIELA